MRLARPAAAGFTLLELLLVVAVVSILSVLMIPNTQPSLCDQLQAVARIVSTDVAYARSLAVSNNDRYAFTWDTTNNQYILQHSGTNPALNILPTTPFSAPGDPPTQHIVELNHSLPTLGLSVKLLVVCTVATTPQRVTTTEFGPLGGTTSSVPTVIWLSAGSAADPRYMSLTIDPVTGLVTIGAYTSVGPPSSVLSG